MSPPSNHSPRKILIATDMCFWRRSTGAEQRAAALIEFLQSQQHTLQTFLLAPSQTLEMADQSALEQNGLDVAVRSSDQVPRQFWKKIGWYIAATRNQYFSQHRSSESPHLDSKFDTGSIDNTPLTLSDFRWDWALDAFREAVDAFQPDVILVEYIKLGYLLESLSPQQRAAIYCIVDTHDVLHLRCQAFKAEGQSHWIEISREEESTALSNFDALIAIQSDEANLLQDLAPNSSVITCGHAPPFSVADNTAPRPVENTPLTIGFLASENAANIDAIHSFLRDIWPLSVSKLGDRIRLVVAGTICGAIDAATYDTDQVSLIGRVDTLEDFYHAVDLVVNPVKYGTGLKIKNVEALAFGKPLLTTQHGAAGLPTELLTGIERKGGLGTEKAVEIFGSPSTFVELVLPFLNPSYRASVSDRAKRLSRTVLSEQSVYSELAQVLSEIG